VQGDERIAYLLDKLHEEADEAREAWLADDEGLVTELADCWEVLLALAEGTGIGWTAVYNARQAKLLKRGGFTQGVRDAACAGTRGPSPSHRRAGLLRLVAPWDPPPEHHGHPQ